MPGLVGIINKNRNENKTLIDSMVMPLMKYDWYKAEEFSHDSFSIMHIHTNILSEQGFVSQGDICACMHGEIYNKDLKNQNQTEYVINLYKEYGRMFPKYLNGSFAIFLFDGKKGSIYLVTDRTASKPILYYYGNERFIFAPELKCILRDPNAKFSVSKHVIADVLSSHFIPSNRTLIEEVLYLEPASILEIKGGQLSIEKYWRYTINEDAEDLGFDYYKEKLSELIQNAVDIRVRSNHRYGISLSGGNDSKMLLGCCKPYVDKITAFSYGNSKRADADAATAKRLAKIVNMKHLFYPYSYKEHFNNQLAFIDATDGMGCCKGMADTVPTWKKVREEQGIQILFCGDNLFGDIYGWYDFEINEEYMFRSLSIYSLERTKQFKPFLRQGCFELLVDLSKENMNKLSQKCKLQDIRARREYFHLEASTFRYYSPWRYAISSEMEVRNPWYDSEILDFMKAIPFEYRHNKSLSKKVGALMFPELFEVKKASMSGCQIRGFARLYSMKKREKDILALLVDGEYPIDEILNKSKIKGLLNGIKLNYIVVKSFGLHLVDFVTIKLQSLKAKLCRKEFLILSRPLDQHLDMEQIVLRLLKLRLILKKANLIMSRCKNSRTVPEKGSITLL